MSKYNVSEEDVEQLYAEIENQGFGYWMLNYAESNHELKRYPELYELVMSASKALEMVQEAFYGEGILE